MNMFYALITILLSGSAYYFSSYFGHFGFLMWIAPIPLLIYVFTQSFWRTLIISLIVGAAAGLNQVIGYWPTLIPHSAFITDVLSQTAELTFVILFSRFLVKRIQNPLSILVFPTCLSLIEWLEAQTIQGTFATIAYSQLHFLPALQIASLTGFIGITFLLSLFASGIAYAIAFYHKHTWALIGLAFSLLITTSILGYGYYRIYQINHADLTRVRVGLISVNKPIHVIMDPSHAQAITDEYKPLIKQLSQAGAKIILTPEESFSVNDQNKSALQNEFGALAKAQQIMLIIGVNETINGKRFNSGWIFDKQGKLLGVYHKRHFVPGIEDGITAGRSIFTTSILNNTTGVAICRDMDYPNPANSYGQHNTGILFVPAWDFDIDADVHASGAWMRGIENGYTVVRAARGGYLSISSPTGEILSNALAVNHHQTTLIGDAPITKQSSFYAKHPLWFVIILWGILVLIICAAFIRRKPTERI